MSYAPDHSGAYADLLADGAPVTFAFVTQGTYDPATDTFGAATTSTVTGAAIRVSGNPLRYSQLGLVQSESPTLLCAPTTFGSLPTLGATVTWGGTTYTVRDVEPLAPDGTAILFRAVVAR